MQKRRVWKVAGAHFLLSVLLVAAAMFFPENFNSPTHGYGLFDVLGSLLLQFFFFLNPLLIALTYLLAWGEFHMKGAGGVVVVVAVMAAGSICFGWLYVKFVGWLNHFPVLGKRVF